MTLWPNSMHWWHFSCERWLRHAVVLLLPAAMFCGCGPGPTRVVEQTTLDEPNVLSPGATPGGNGTLQQGGDPVDAGSAIAVYPPQAAFDVSPSDVDAERATRQLEHAATSPDKLPGTASTARLSQGREPKPPSAVETRPEPEPQFAADVAPRLREATPVPEPSAKPLKVRELPPFKPIEGLCDGTDPSTGTKTTYAPPVLANGEDVLQLDLPDRLDLLQLLDLAAEYLNLDYLCDPEALRGQTVSLRLHGKLRGEIRVKDLYPLLESVLKFKGYAMTCHQDHVVTIVPLANALEADPALISTGSGALQAGNMIVTRLFDLQYVTTATVTGLLEKMKLSVAVSPVEETQTLVVTGYAQRMDRIEQLLHLVDRPGRPKEFRVRPLKYAMAGALIGKIEMLATELQVAPVRVPATPVRRGNLPSPGLMDRGSPAGDAGPLAGRAVYLDADERTNRILMVGYPEELTLIENAVDALDLARQDPRTARVYPIRRLRAADVLSKLQEMKAIGMDVPAGAMTARSAPAAPGALLAARAAPEDVAEQPQVAVIESTNALLIHATPEQHTWIATLIDHIDAAPQDLRTLQVYDLKHVDAGEARKKLEEFEVIARTAKSGASLAAAASPGPAPAEFGTPGPTPEATPLSPQVAVLETTNSLLVNATEEQQHAIQKIIARIDTEVRQEAIPYEIYFLENQEPEHLAEILGKIIQETIKDKEGKIEKVIRKTDEEIVIVPDAGTFSLIVYANRKNQDWISKLVKALDKRRPQVLIDVTLVEITKTEAFTYDLNWIQGIPNLTVTSGVTGALVPTVPGEPPVRLPQDVTHTLAQTGRDYLLDLQSDSGSFRGFYGDRHINVLLQAMAAKNYGRVLAKPKVLVNDNEPGTIKTTDTTYVEVTSSVPVSTGNAGPETTLIETSREFQSYEAGIELQITPHISEGDLLRLKIELSRSDFLPVGRLDRPPDTRANNLATAVTVPDGSTIILGGLQKLNQNKSGRKVPILGDIPFIGALFRGVDQRDLQSNLYVFVKAEVIRPARLTAQRMQDLEALSQKNREAFERHEQEFQKYEAWPGIKPKPVPPPKVLEAR